MTLRFIGSMCSVVIKFKSLTTGHFLSFHSRVVVQQISCTNTVAIAMK